MPVPDRPALLLLILIASGCNLPRRALILHLTPARLEREVLTLEFRPDRVHVKAHFHFTRDGKPEYITCLFPDAGYPVAARDGTTPHPAVHGFRVTHNGRPLPVTRLSGKNRLEFPARFSGRDTYAVRYTAPWRTIRGQKVFGYALKTGGLWEGGRIGTLRIIIINRTGGNLRLSPPYDRQLVFRNFEPIHDIKAVLE